MTLVELAIAWRARADELAPYTAPAAEAFRRAAAELEAELLAQRSETLSLAEAALESGYSSDSLRHKVAKGEIPNAGRRGAPRIRRSDLPRRVKSSPASGAGSGQPTGYDVGADALSIVRRRGAQ